MFNCSFCQRKVPDAKSGGVHSRNHCPYCLWSKHVDNNVGDRKARCHGGMEPIGLTFKKEQPNKYGTSTKGELMIIHQCFLCHKKSINRVAGDDNANEILGLLNKHRSAEQLESLKSSQIIPLTDKDRAEVEKQLFGR